MARRNHSAVQCRVVLGGFLNFRLNHGPICFPVQNTRGCYRSLEVKYHFLGDFKFTLEPPISIGHGEFRLCNLDEPLLSFFFLVEQFPTYD